MVVVNACARRAAALATGRMVLMLPRVALTSLGVMLPAALTWAYNLHVGWGGGGENTRGCVRVCVCVCVCMCVCTSMCTQQPQELQQQCIDTPRPQRQYTCIHHLLSIPPHPTPPQHATLPPIPCTKRPILRVTRCQKHISAFPQLHPILTHIPHSCKCLCVVQLISTHVEG